MWCHIKIILSLLVVVKIAESKAIDAKTNPCNKDEYLNPVTKNCSALLGGGEAMFIDQSKQCVNNFIGVKPYPDNEKFYVICDTDFVVLANCRDNSRFDTNTLKCEAINKFPCNVTQMPTCINSGRFALEQNCSCFYTCNSADGKEELISTIMQCPGTSLYSPAIRRCSYSFKTPPTEILNESDIDPDERGIFPPCTKPGKFRVPTDCSKYYTCSTKTNGRFYQSRFKCSDGFYYDCKLEECKPYAEVTCDMMSIVEILNLFDYYRTQKCGKLNNTDNESIVQCMNATNEPNIITTEQSTKIDIISSTPEQILNTVTTPKPNVNTASNESQIETSTATSLFSSTHDYDDDDEKMELLSAESSLRERKRKTTLAPASTTITSVGEKTSSFAQVTNESTVGSNDIESSTVASTTETLLESTTNDNVASGIEIVSTENSAKVTESMDVLAAIKEISTEPDSDDYVPNVGSVQNTNDDFLTTTSTDKSEPLRTTTTMMTTTTFVQTTIPNEFTSISNETESSENVTTTTESTSTTIDSNISISTEETTQLTEHMSTSTTETSKNLTTEMPEMTTSQPFSTTIENDDFQSNVGSIQKIIESDSTEGTNQSLLESTTNENVISDLDTNNTSTLNTIFSTTEPTISPTILSTDDSSQSITMTEQSTISTLSTEVAQSSDGSDAPTEANESTSTTVSNSPSNSTEHSISSGNISNASKSITNSTENIQMTSSSSTSGTEIYSESVTKSSSDVTTTFKPSIAISTLAPNMDFGTNKTSLESHSLLISSESQDTPTTAFFGADQTTSPNDLTTLESDIDSTTTEMNQQNLNGTTEIESKSILNESTTVDTEMKSTYDSSEMTTILSTTPNPTQSTDLNQLQTSETSVPTDATIPSTTEDALSSEPNVGSINTRSGGSSIPTESESPPITVPPNEQSSSSTDPNQFAGNPITTSQKSDLIDATIFPNITESPLISTSPKSKEINTETQPIDTFGATQNSDERTPIENESTFNSNEPGVQIGTTTASLLEILTTTLWPTAIETADKNQTTTESTSIDSSTVNQTTIDDAVSTTTAEWPHVLVNNSFIEMDEEKVPANAQPILSVNIKRNVFFKVNFTGADCC
ncbi:flocculation protein FLO11-like [Contarinia nasturtii]|uniref:flocculation protein FLO11-like n=1 Tax=Contarinia nasturtii TaxID=265458 RepID=UPI0012D477F5|nr:flocculation protein FLO11-like [Contarinia nasturtii]